MYKNSNSLTIIIFLLLASCKKELIYNSKEYSCNGVQFYNYTNGRGNFIYTYKDTFEISFLESDSRFFKYNFDNAYTFYFQFYNDSVFFTESKPLDYHSPNGYKSLDTFWFYTKLGIPNQVNIIDTCFCTPIK